MEMTSEYVLIIIWIAIAPMLLKTIDTHEEITVAGKREYRYKFLWAFIIFLPIIIMAGTRGSIGDTDAYRKMFQEMPQAFSGLEHYFSTLSKDKGFYISSALIKIIVGANTKTYFLILAAIQGFCLVKIYRKYSVNYTISVFLFLASSDYISWMYNGIRQFMAVVITFASIGFLLKNSKIKYIIAILIASLFHQSALILIPFAFVVDGRAWNKKTIFFILAALLAVAFIGQFTNFLDNALAETQYKNVVSDWKEFEDDGTNVLRVLVYSVPTILSYLGRRIIWDKDNRLINLCVNMSIVSTGLYVVSMFTSGIFIGRLPIYFSLFNYILLPWEIKNLFTEKSGRLMHVAMIAAYLVFYYYQMHLVYGYF